MKPRKLRNVLLPPRFVSFKPQGVALRDTETILLSIEEYEALRLADFEKLKHYEAAEKMNISRPTFTRLLESAHSKTAEAFVEGRAIRIEGGDYKLAEHIYGCRRCGYAYNYNAVDQSKPSNCPQCSSEELYEVKGQMPNRPQKGRWHGPKRII